MASGTYVLGAFLFKMFLLSNEAFQNSERVRKGI
jgi:hypothetical protein